MTVSPAGGVSAPIMAHLVLLLAAASQSSAAAFVGQRAAATTTVLPRSHHRPHENLSVVLLPPRGALADDSGSGDCESTASATEVFLESSSSRKSFLRRLGGFAAWTAAGIGAASSPQRAAALVKGNAPPPKKKAEGVERKCSNVEECQEMAERLAAKQDEEMRANATPAQVAPGGSRYKDVEDGSSDLVAKDGDNVVIRYKVLKLGKRSYDGLSGEGTVVFSRGYGLEDDEEKPGVKSFDFRIGDPTVIAALNDAVPGMHVGGTRRIGVLPQMGWRKADKSCDGGPGGSGAGGELKTDYVVVPTATMVATETCFDKTMRPFPTTYAEQRRMAQRFDQSLIVEVELVGIS